MRLCRRKHWRSCWKKIRRAWKKKRRNPAKLKSGGQYNQPMLRLMAITAHPDDEGSFGGSLLTYHERGVETFLVCLTPGQAATHRGGARNDQELAEMRKKEFARSCELLKISKGVVLNFPDGKLHRIDLYNVVCELTKYVRELRPNVLITFGPEGGVTGHTDHTMAGVAATLAFEWAGRSNRFPDQLKNGVEPHRAQKLYQTTAEFELPGRQPIMFSPVTATIEVGRFVEAKIASFKCHTSQSPLWPIFEGSIRQNKPIEQFHLAARSNPGPAIVETDLFAGITE
jgi:LmbE family N-acetylglucosaminyl deacetylase